MILRIVNAGFSMCIDVPDAEIESVHRRLLARFGQAAADRRAVVLVAGAPGSGKSTLCGIWQALANMSGLSLCTMSLDGFHLPNAVLRERGLMARKGAPETYDLKGANRALREVKEGRPVSWPVYDRNLHEPIEGPPVPVNMRIVVIEGNYVLLEAPGWRGLRDDSAMTVMIRPDWNALKDRIIQRHMRGGRTREEAERKFSESDLPNILLVEEHSLPADIILRQSANGRFAIERE
jgi:hypothetical protein